MSTASRALARHRDITELFSEAQDRVRAGARLDWTGTSTMRVGTVGGRAAKTEALRRVIAGLVATGLRIQQIARALGVSARCVEYHMDRSGVRCQTSGKEYTPSPWAHGSLAGALERA